MSISRPQSRAGNRGKQSVGTGVVGGCRRQLGGAHGRPWMTDIRLRGRGSDTKPLSRPLPSLPVVTSAGKRRLRRPAPSAWGALPWAQGVPADTHARAVSQREMLADGQGRVCWTASAPRGRPLSTSSGGRAWERPRFRRTCPSLHQEGAVDHSRCTPGGQQSTDLRETQPSPFWQGHHPLHALLRPA